MTELSMKKQQRKMVRHSLELKISLAKRVIEGQESPSALARETSISSVSIGGWVRQARAGKLEGYVAPDFDVQTGDVAAENARLVRELKRVTMERDFLKKVSAYFAKDPQ